jgi:hypothetical protein
MFLQSNLGHFRSWWISAALEEPCPEEECGNLLSPPVVPSAVPNPFAPDWPELVMDNQCEWWPLAAVCSDGTVTDSPT